MAGTEDVIGRIVRYYSGLGVGVVELTGGGIELGEILLIRGRRTELYQRVRSLQIDRVPVRAAGSGNLAGLKVDGPVRPGDGVYRLRSDPENGTE